LTTCQLLCYYFKKSMISSCMLNTKFTNYLYDNNVHTSATFKKKWWRIWWL